MARRILVGIATGLVSLVFVSSAFGSYPTINGEMVPTSQNAIPIGNNFNVNLPAVTEVAELLQVYIECAEMGNMSAPVGWTKLAQMSGRRLAVFYRIADGNEPSNVDFTPGHTVGSSSCHAAAVRIGGYDSVAPVMTYSAVSGCSSGCTFGTSSQINPPIHDPSGWGDEPALWIAIGGWNAGTAFGAFPDTWNEHRHLVTLAGNGMYLAMAAKSQAVFSSDPGPFTDTQSGRVWDAMTIAVKGGTAGTGGGEDSDIAGDGGSTDAGGGLIGMFTGGIVAILTAILCVLQNLLQTVVAAIIMAINSVIAALAAVAQALVDTLPDMPDLPAIPDWILDGFGYGAYFFPVTFLVTCLSLLLLLWTAWFIVAIPLRWGKLTDD